MIFQGEKPQEQETQKPVSGQAGNGREEPGLGVHPQEGSEVHWRLLLPQSQDGQNF